MLRSLAALLFSAALLLAQTTAPTDAQVEASLRERLAKSVIGQDGLKFSVKAGVVYWEGFTAVAQHKGAATRMAKSAGARRVVNNIRVRNAKPPGAPAAPKPTAPKPTAPSAAPPKTTAEASPLRRATVRWVSVTH